MARGRSVIVGGGLGTVGAIAVGAFTYIGVVDPASVQISSLLGQGTNAVVIAATRTDPAASATEVLHIRGGAIIEGTVADSVVIGRAASANSNGVAIGQAAVLSGSGVVVGVGSTSAGGGVSIHGTNSAGGSPSVVIAGTLSGAAGQAVVIGGAAITALGVVCIGGSAVAQASNVVALGYVASVLSPGGIAIGPGATVNGAGAFTNSIAIGNGCGAFAAQQLNIGSNASATPINTVVIGHGLDTVAAPTGVTIRLTNASGLNAAAGNLILRAGVSTGSAVAGDFQVQVGVPGGSSSVLQTAVTRLAVRSSVTALDTWLMVFDVDNGLLERVSVGVADSGGAGFKLLRIAN